MTSIAIMQPYFFPYIGYYQLIDQVDIFVILDNVHYIKRGWINRNRILKAQRNIAWLTLPLQKASQNRLINNHVLHASGEQLLPSLHQAYCNAPYYKQIFPILEKLLNYPKYDLVTFLQNSLSCVQNLLNIYTKTCLSSSLGLSAELNGQDRILAICKSLQATRYLNLSGGSALYDAEKFFQNEIELCFIKRISVPYQQFTGDFIADLSIIDILMFNSIATVQGMLKKYEMEIPVAHSQYADS